MGGERNLPKDEGLDNSLKLLKEGYEYILNRQHRYQTDVFETRLLGEKAICLTGKDAAEIFYDNSKFERSEAAPGRVKKTLFGEGGVQGLDGEAHKHRKEMFMSVMSKESLQEIIDLTEKQWDLFAARWETKDEIVLYEEAKKILTKVACEWTGVPLEDDEVEDLADQLSNMFEASAAIGPAHWKGRIARSRGEDWIEELVEKVREGKVNPPENKPLYTFSWHRDLDGNLLDKSIVAVEILNLLRPMVAITVYICFTAHAVYFNKEEADKLKNNDSERLHWFMQEVRRFYPFFPFTAARVKDNFSWRGYEFEEGTLTLLDLYGTNHHPEYWENPDRFEPERFAEWSGSPFDFIPQGGGEFEIGHRCAGEWITMDIMKVSLDHLVNKLSYEIPEQDLSFSMVDMPSVPESHIVMKNIKRK